MVLSSESAPPRPLTKEARRAAHSDWQWKVVWVLIGLLALTAFVIFLDAWLANARRCDETCSGPAHDWRDTLHAWQWPVQLAIATISWLSALGGLWAHYFAHSNTRTAMVIASIAGAGAWYAVITSP